MFRSVPGCSGMFHVPGFVEAQVKMHSTFVTCTSNESTVERFQSSI